MRPTKGSTVSLCSPLEGILRVVGGAPGSAPGVLNERHGIDVSRDGLLYVADTFNKRIQVFR